MKDTNLRIKDAEIEISKLAKTIRQTTDALGGMGTDIAEIEEKNSTIEAGLAQTNADLAGVKETASQQAAELANLQTTTTQHTAHITTLQNGTAGLANRVSAVEKTASENSSKIAQNSAQITQNTQGLEAHAETLTDFDTSIKFLSNTSSDLLERVALLEDNAGESSAELEPRLAEVERKQAEAQIEINALNNALGETKSTVASLETQVAENKEAIEELKAGGTGAADTTALEQQIAQNATNIEALQATVTTLQTATQVNATNIAENTAKIAGIQENYRVVANALNRITELEKLHGLAEEVWGTRGTTVEEITALLDDYATESNFCTETTTHLQFGTFGDTGPSARIFFRQNPLRTTSPRVILKFDFSSLPSGISALPCTITLNGVDLFSGSLSVDTTATEFQATADLTIDPSAHNIVMFNEINVQFNSTTLSATILDFVQVEISGSQNCIVLNRANHVNIYGWANSTSGSKRLICSKYYKGEGFKTFMSTGETHLMDLENTKTAFPATTAGGYPIVYASRYTQENFNNNSNGKFSTTSNNQLDYYINSQNQFFFINTMRNANTLTETYPHLNNVLYAKKSLHNGANFFIEYATIVYQDFSIGLHYAHYYDALENNILAAITLLFSKTNYPKEFVDFIPVYDYMVGGTRTSLQNVGYFLLHKSGNILFVPEKEATYFIKIGKGRQVTASYHTDMMGIDIFYEHNGKIYKKVLERTETNSTEWVLSETVETIENADYIYENDLYQFKILKGEITQILKI